MKTLAARKIVAIFTAVSLAFLQAVPAGVAATKPVEEVAGTSVPTSEKPVMETSAQQTPAVVVPQTSTDFLSGSPTLSKSSRTSKEEEVSDKSVKVDEATPQRPIDDIKTPVVSTPVLIGPPVSDEAKPIVEAVQNDLAGRLEVPAESVTVVSAVSVTWNDSCLGVSTGQNCKMVPTPGNSKTAVIPCHGNSTNDSH